VVATSLAVFSSTTSLNLEREYSTGELYRFASGAGVVVEARSGLVAGGLFRMRLADPARVPVTYVTLHVPDWYSTCKTGADSPDPY
jgi:hypothetical protein